MYTFKQAVKDCKQYLETDYCSHLLATVAKRKTVPSYREIITAVDDCYHLYMKRLLFKGALYNIYRERKTLADTILLPEIIANKIIPTLVLFCLCEDFMADELKELREIILELVKLSETYIISDKVPIKNYNEIQNLEI